MQMDNFQPLEAWFDRKKKQSIAPEQHVPIEVLQDCKEEWFPTSMKEMVFSHLLVCPTCQKNFEQLFFEHVTEKPTQTSFLQSITQSIHGLLANLAPKHTVVWVALFVLVLLPNQLTQQRQGNPWTGRKGAPERAIPPKRSLQLFLGTSSMNEQSISRIDPTKKYKETTLLYFAFRTYRKSGFIYLFKTTGEQKSNIQLLYPQGKELHFLKKGSLSFVEKGSPANSKKSRVQAYSLRGETKNQHFILVQTKAPLSLTDLHLLRKKQLHFTLWRKYLQNLHFVEDIAFHSVLLQGK